MTYDTATALSPLDGRYASILDPLRTVFSEYGLIARRLEVEVRWLQKMAETSEIPEVNPLSPTSNAHLESVLTSFSAKSAAAVKTIERTTNHDVKAIEYFLKDALRLTWRSRKPVSLCTSHAPVKTSTTCHTP